MLSLGTNVERPTFIAASSPRLRRAYRVVRPMPYSLVTSAIERSRDDLISVVIYMHLQARCISIYTLAKPRFDDGRRAGPHDLRNRLLTIIQPEDHSGSKSGRG